jgi:DNA-binding IclR family transcriptional regulator
MTEDGLSDGVRALLENGVDSYEKIDVILFLWRERGTWDVSQIATAMKLSAADVSKLLGELTEARLVVSPKAGHFAVEPTAIADLGALARTFEDSPVLVVQSLSRSAMRRLRRSTADAFVQAFERARNKPPQGKD